MLSYTLLLGIPLFLAPQGEEEYMTYYLKKNPKNIKSIRAHIRGVDGTQVDLVRLVGNQTIPQDVDLKWFDDTSAIRILHSAAKMDGSVQSWLRLANFAVDKGKVGDAVRAWNEAVKLSGSKDPDPATKAKIDKTAAIVLEGRFHDELQAGKLDAARRTLKLIETKYSDSQAAKDRDLLAAAHGKREAAIEQKKEQEKSAEQGEENKRILESAQKYLDAGTRALNEALGTGKNSAMTQRGFKLAGREFDRAAKRADWLLKKYAEDQSLVEALGQLRSKAEAGYKQAMLSLSSACLTQGNYNDALGYSNAIMARYHRDRDALAMRARIGSAASEDSQWGRGLRRIRR